MIGNDNYRPGLIPPEPIKRSGGWLSSNMAQLMVFLNGLILTVTAFATLSVFIDEIVKDGLVRTTQDTEQYITTHFDEMERNINAISTIITISEAEDGRVVEDYIKQQNKKSSDLKEVYFIKDNQQITTLLGQPEFLNGFKNKSIFLDYIKAETQRFSDDPNLHVLSNLPNLNPLISENKFKIEQNYIALFKPVSVEGQGASYVLAITRLGDVIDPEWFSSRPSIRDIEITDSRDDSLIYAYKASLFENAKEAGYTNLLKISMNGHEFNVKLNLIINSRESFLQKIPFLMLIFGITLTLIGTLYVRNNQSQSKKLSEMNKELAYKNFELNQQVEERERLSSVIQKSAHENRSIINSVSDIIFELSSDGKIIFVNDAWQQVTAFESQRSIGRNLFDLIYPQDQDEQRQNFDQLVKGNKKSYRAFTRLRSADGSFRAIELAVSMTRQDENKELRVVGTITDVEDRRRAERALSEAEKKYRAIVENAAGGIYQVTPDGQFLSANPAMANILGYDTPEDILRNIDKTQSQIYVDLSARQKFLNEISVLDISKNIESQIMRKDKSVIWVSENVRPVHDDEGTLLFYEGSMENVDQRKKAEIALTQAKIESDLANRAKSEFLANMSHELRTPLNSVIGFSEIIKNEAFGKLPNKEYKEYADDIYDSGNKLLRVINEILDVSRIEAGERALSEGVVKVSEVVKSCLDLMEGKFKASKMRIENKVKNNPIAFIGETQAVKQMLLNLMSNSLKFSPENSFMMLDAEVDSQGRLRLSITDTGVGMNDEELEKALSPFGQLDTEHKRSKSGTGLGLTLVKSLVGLHGGELEMVSQKGIGTTATLIFPAKRVASVRAEKESPSAKDSVTTHPES